MGNPSFKTVDAYIASKPEATQSVLKRIRNAIRRALPDAEEVISYNIPTYKVGRAPLLYFAGWKQHCSLYPVTADLLAEFKDQLAPYEVENGTIRFPLSQPVPTTLIGRIAAFRARGLATREKAKAAAPRRRH